MLFCYFSSIVKLRNRKNEHFYVNQRWSRGHKARKPRPRTTLPRTDTFETKDRNARGQGPRTQTQVFCEKKGLQNFFSGEKGLKKSVSGDLQLRKTKKVFANFSRDFWRFPTKFQRFKT